MIKKPKNPTLFTMNGRMRQLRKDNNLSQKEMAEKLDVTYETYRNYEYFRRSIPIYLIPELVEILNTSYEYLFEGKSENIENDQFKNELEQILTTNKEILFLIKNLDSNLQN